MNLSELEQTIQQIKKLAALRDRLVAAIGEGGEEDDKMSFEMTKFEAVALAAAMDQVLGGVDK